MDSMVSAGHLWAVAAGSLSTGAMGCFCCFCYIVLEEGPTCHRQDFRGIHVAGLEQEEHTTQDGCAVAMCFLPADASR